MEVQLKSKKFQNWEIRLVVDLAKNGIFFLAKFRGMQKIEKF